MLNVQFVNWRDRSGGRGDTGAMGLCMRMGLVAAKRFTLGDAIFLCRTWTCRGAQGIRIIGTYQRSKMPGSAFETRWQVVGRRAQKIGLTEFWWRVVGRKNCC